MKTYVLMVSRYFPATHPRNGEPTYFPENILNALNKRHLIWPNLDLNLEIEGGKLHTIRDNYELWKRRIDEVNAGKAVLSVRYWTSSPYNYKRDGSKQKEFIKLSKGECGIQKLEFSSAQFNAMLVDDEYCFSDIENSIAKNDSLSFEDFEAWFKGYDLSTPKAIIHFTNFKY